jgi:hypothetical protein
MVLGCQKEREDFTAGTASGWVRAWTETRKEKREERKEKRERRKDNAEALSGQRFAETVRGAGAALIAGAMGHCVKVA